MPTATWFDNEEERFNSCLEAVMGYYGIPRRMLLKNIRGNPQGRVFMRLLFLCRVAPGTVRHLTAWDRLTTANNILGSDDQTLLRWEEKRVAQVLMHHIVTSTGDDDELPPNDADFATGWWQHLQNTKLDHAWGPFRNRPETLTNTSHWRKWERKFNKVNDSMSSWYKVVRVKRDAEDLLDQERWQENPANDCLIWEAFRDYSTLHQWKGLSVFIVRGYQMALRLSGERLAAFEGDGRIVILAGEHGKSQYSPHCIIFFTSDEARSFVNIACRPPLWIVARDYQNSFAQSP